MSFLRMILTFSRIWLIASQNIEKVLKWSAWMFESGRNRGENDSQAPVPEKQQQDHLQFITSNLPCLEGSVKLGEVLVRTSDHDLGSMDS